MMYVIWASGAALAYLLGSFSSAVWIGRWFYGKDVRDYGSGNAGTTNTVRVLGTKPGLAVFMLDVFKGWAAVSLDFFMLRICPSMAEYRAWVDITLAACVVAGHIFPLYTGFRGGKGVATILGVLAAVYPIALWPALAVWALVFICTRYVSLASVCAALAFPFLDIFLVKDTDPVLRVFACVMGAVLILTHIKNIKRLIRRQESKLRFKK